MGAYEPIVMGAGPGGYMAALRAMRPHPTLEKALEDLVEKQNKQ